MPEGAGSGKRGRGSVPAGHALLLTLLAMAAAWARPAPLQASPDPRYYRYGQVLAQFDQWAAQYPDLFHREVLGYSGAGRPIWAAKISARAALHEAEPCLLFHAAQHSNEPNGTGAILYMMRRLLEGYGEDPYYTSLADHLEMWFVPIVNVDGHEMAFSDSLDVMNWRKTVRDNNGDGRLTWPQDGVDLNRNWDWRWSEDGENNPSSEYYKGPAPFSEVETVAMREFILRRRPLIVMDFHSPYQHSMGDVIFWTWMNSGGPSAPDEPIFRSIVQGLEQHTLTETGQHYSGIAGFNTLPKEQNWVYAHTEICVLLMEITLDNYWTGAMVDTIAARTGRGNFYLMDRALSGPGVRGRVADALSGTPLQAEIRVEQIHDPAIGPFLGDAETGCYWRFLNPGTFILSVHAKDHEDQTRTVTVGSGGWTTEDFDLVPVESSVGEPLDPADGRGSAGGIRLILENPLARGGRILLSCDAGPEVTCELFNLCGERVRSLFRGGPPPGGWSILWDGLDDSGQPLPAGVYLFRTRAGAMTTARKVVLSR